MEEVADMSDMSDEEDNNPLTDNNKIKSVRRYLIIMPRTN